MQIRNMQHKSPKGKNIAEPVIKTLKG